MKNAVLIYQAPAGGGFVRGGVQRQVLESPLGSSLAVRDASGTQVGMTGYDAFGQEEYATGTDRGGSLRFAGGHGYQTDDASGMQLLGARYYIPSLGRFLTQDPIGHEGGLNLYAYCDNSPLSRVDPDGTQSRRLHGAWISGDTTFPANLSSPSWMLGIAISRAAGERADTYNGPSRAQMERILSSRLDYVAIMGHGNFGHMYFNTGASFLDAAAINRIADARDKAGLGKMNTISVWECWVMGDRAMVNALLRIANNVQGYEGMTFSSRWDSLGRPGTFHRYTRPFPRGAMSGQDGRGQYLGKGQ